jgi:hypothetical protein
VTEVKKTADDPSLAALSARTTDDDVSRQGFDARREGGWSACKQRRDGMCREGG